MSKKNRRKSNFQKSEPLPRSDFEVSNSKSYVIAAIIIFHIVPLIFVALTFALKQNFMLLYMQFSIQFNSVLTAALGFIYGMKRGFNLKFPIFLSVIAALSLMFYGEFVASQSINVLFAFGFVYALFAFGSILLGAFLKKTFHID